MSELHPEKSCCTTVGPGFDSPHLHYPARFQQEPPSRGRAWNARAPAPQQLPAGVLDGIRVFLAARFEGSPVGRVRLARGLEGRRQGGEQPLNVVGAGGPPHGAAQC